MATPEKTVVEIDTIAEKKKELWNMISKLHTKLGQDQIEAPTEEDAAHINALLDMKDYADCRDIYIQLLILCFYFDCNPVKKAAAIIIDNMLIQGVVEPSIILGLLHGEYISRKTYFILRKHSETIKKHSWYQTISSALQRIQSKDGCEITRCNGGSCERIIIPLSDEKRGMLKELISIYSTPYELNREGISLEDIAISQGGGE